MYVGGSSIYPCPRNDERIFQSLRAILTVAGGARPWAIVAWVIEEGVTVTGIATTLLLDPDLLRNRRNGRADALLFSP